MNAKQVKKIRRVAKAACVKYGIAVGTTYKLGNDKGQIVPRESEQLQAIAEAVPFGIRQRWLAAARNLIAATDTFNLDKHYTIRLMLDPERVTAQFPAAA